MTGTISGPSRGAAANLPEDFQRIKLVSPAADAVEKVRTACFAARMARMRPRLRMWA